MENLWNAKEAKKYTGELALRVYTSRLLGKDTSLVLHGGGNTSVKITETNLVGKKEQILYVKGSGWDLATIEEEGFAPVRLNHMIELGKLESLSDPQMVNELKSNMTNASAPSPSVETILHALIPFKYVDHTHSDAIVTITNTPAGEERIKKIFGDKVIIIPYVMPGFDLARLVGEMYQKENNENTIGMVLLNHGIFSFADTAKESYDRMIELVNFAEDYLKNSDAWNLHDAQPYVLSGSNSYVGIARLRKDISAAAGKPMIVNITQSNRGLEFSNLQNINDISQQGPATPDHVIRTKQLPLIERDVDSYTKEYKVYFDTYAKTAKEKKSILDTAPRVILDKELGLCAVGKSFSDASIVSDIYEHTMACILRAEKLDKWKALPGNDIFDMEYWDLEQAKLKKSGSALEFQGEVVLITGGASGIGKACIESFLKRGAAVAGLDINEDILTTSTHTNYFGICCDITDENAIKNALQNSVMRFGGIDMVILNAGMFPAGKKVSELATKDWRKVMNVNLDSNFTLLRETYPLLKLAPKNGRVVIIGSKNVPAPGPGAAAYSASKAALNQLMRVTALEWGSDKININTVHPNAVFDTGIWTDEVLESRAKHYNLTVEEYKTNNVLKINVTSHNVAEMAADMCSSIFSRTTASQVPVDGGNDRVI
jgi:rhamnose utilization protein RhaD (predicted bifunctional aldolase and dehydrogenase)/NAD(P)-dependent dehydrogenase (short-subunit alcohol dehydrogenase family)